MEIVKNYDGAWVCSDIVEGVREHRIYMGYSKSYAQKLFRQEMKRIKERIQQDEMAVYRSIRCL